MEEEEGKLADVAADERTPKPPKKKRNVGTGRGLREAIESERTVTAMSARAERADEPQLDVEMRDLSGGHAGQGVGIQSW